ncbi:hypothetical protein Aca07nite_12700 [Actinoplanes capillaceus]|uniref:Uncharacterized protein n=1 Tax=Actinoplanes campanulatus TaxID=113559 RepID=A0ABQ3WC88_9ACTN|nr:hypothetical protein Aca07nite_12700 [Actinoplanes capillaceus]
MRRDLEEHPLRIVEVGEQLQTWATDHVRVAGGLTAGQHHPPSPIAWDRCAGRDIGLRHRDDQHIALTEHPASPAALSLSRGTLPRGYDNFQRRIRCPTKIRPGLEMRSRLCA